MSHAGDMTPKNMIKGIVKVQKNGNYGLKATIPKDVAEELGIAPGDPLLVGIDEHRRIVMLKEGVLA